MSNSNNPAPTSSHRRTIFIVLDGGTAIRNVLRTDIFTTLKSDPALRIVIFSPIVDADFRKEFEGPNVVVEQLPVWRANAMVSFYRSIRKNVWMEQFGLTRFSEKRQAKDRLLARLATRFLVRSKPRSELPALAAELEARERRAMPALGAKLFEKYQPDLVFFTTIFSPHHCLELGALQRGVKTAAMILSWDNPTTKGPLPARPERVIVWNELLKRELMEYHNFRSEQICVAGVAQFDIYSDTANFVSRDEYFRRWGLDPKKRLITYTTGTPGTAPFDHEIVDLLYQRMEAGAFSEPTSLLVRLHPKDEAALYKRWEGKPNIVIQIPGRKANVSDCWNPTRDDMYALAELMRYSDVVVNIASTITIDAAAFDTPTVNVAFDGYEKKPYNLSCKRYYDYEHYKRIVDTGGIKISDTIDELIVHIQRYLDDPKQEAEGRARIRSEQCWQLDGQAGKRVGQYLLDYIAAS